MVDDQLLWKYNINVSVSKISRGIGVLRYMKPYALKFALIQVYNATVLTLSDYCGLVWDACSDYLTEKPQKMQNRSRRDIAGKSYETRSSEILADFEWQTLDERMKTKKVYVQIK